MSPFPVNFFFFNEYLPTHCSSKMNAAHSCRATGLLWETTLIRQKSCVQERTRYFQHTTTELRLRARVCLSGSLLGHTGRVCHVEEDHRWGTEQSCGPANSSLLLMSTFCSGRKRLYFIATLTLAECHRASPVQYWLRTCWPCRSSSSSGGTRRIDTPSTRVVTRQDVCVCVGSVLAEELKDLR